jgi:hypothetical protein
VFRIHQAGSSRTTRWPSRPSLRTLSICSMALARGARRIADSGRVATALNAKRWQTDRTLFVVIPEGAGPCQRGFQGFEPWRGVRDRASCFPAAAIWVARGRAGSRTGRSPAAVAAPKASLRRAGREPHDQGGGKREAGPWGYQVVQVRPRAGNFPVRAVPLAAVIPSRVPGGGRERMGRSASEQAVRRGQSSSRPRRRVAAGQTTLRPRAWPRPGKVMRLARPG